MTAIDKIQVLDSIEKELLLCLQSAGKKRVLKCPSVLRPVSPTVSLVFRASSVGAQQGENQPKGDGDPHEPVSQIAEHRRIEALGTDQLPHAGVHGATARRVRICRSEGAADGMAPDSACQISDQGTGGVQDQVCAGYEPIADATEWTKRGVRRSNVRSREFRLIRW